MGVCLVSACTQVLRTCSDQAMQQSFSSAEAGNAVRLYQAHTSDATILQARFDYQSFGSVEVPIVPQATRSWNDVS
jgi:hypothetical protein